MTGFEAQEAAKLGCRQPVLPVGFKGDGLQRRAREIFTLSSENGREFFR